MILRGLRDSVGTPSRVCAHGSIGADEENDATLVEHHRSGERLRETKRTNEVDREDTLEILAVGVEKERHRDRAQRACVVHDDRWWSSNEGRGCSCDAMDRVLVADIEGESVRFTAFDLDLANRSFERLFAARDEDDLRAPSSEVFRQLTAKSPGSSRHQRCFVLDVHVLQHGLSLPSQCHL
jgi:hypothetical protein